MALIRSILVFAVFFLPWSAFAQAGDPPGNDQTSETRPEAAPVDSDADPDTDADNDADNDTGTDGEQPADTSGDADGEQPATPADTDGEQPATPADTDGEQPAGKSESKAKSAEDTGASQVDAGEVSAGPDASPDASEPGDEPVDLGKGEVIVITGSRVEQPLAATTVATEVITRKEIEASGAASVAELLEEHPGIEVVDGLQGTSIGIQGLDPAYVLVLVDGQRAIGRVNGAIDLERYGVEGIERIEIVKGASSALYGADALAGVINIITRTPQKPVEARILAQYGGLGVVDTTGLVGLRVAGLSTRFSGGYHRGDGYDLDPSNLHTTGSAFEQWQVANQSSYRRGPAELVLALDYLRRDLRGINSLVVEGTDATAVLDRVNLVEMATGSLRGQWKLARARRLSAALNYSLYRDQFAYDQRGAEDLDQYEETIETLAEATAQFDGAITRQHYVTAGVEGMREFLESPRLRARSGDPDCDLIADADCDRGGDRYRMAGYAQDEWMILSDPSLIVVPALRVDMDSQFGTHVSPKLAARWDPHEQVVVRASYGRGFRAPDFKQLHLCYENPNAGYFVMGNPELQPENSHNTNLGVELRPGSRLWVSANIYYNILDNLIAFDSADNTMPALGCGLGTLAPYTYRNIVSAYSRGVETLVRTRPRIGPITGLLVEVGYVFNDSRDEELDGPLPGTSRHRGTFKLGYESPRLGLEAQIRGSVVGARSFYENLEGMVATDPHATVDARVAQTFAQRFTAFAGVKNLFDEGNPEVLPIAPRTFYAGMIAKY